MNSLPILALLLSADLPQTPGMHEEVLSQPGSPLIRYTISLPKGYQPGEARPLALALHYGGTVTPYYGRGFLEQLVEPGLRNLGAILVAPDCPYQGWDNPESEKAVMALLQYMLNNYSVDRRRVLLTGFSMGGRGTWYLASRHTGVFSAAIPMAGRPEGAETDKILAAKLPVFIIHSRDDEVVPIGPTERAVEALKAGGAPVEFLALRGMTHYEVRRLLPALKKTVGWLKNLWGPT